MRKIHIIIIALCIIISSSAIVGYRYASNDPVSTDVEVIEKTLTKESLSKTTNMNIEKLDKTNNESDTHLQSTSMSASKYANFENVIDKIIADTE